MPRLLIFGHTGQVAAELERQPLPAGWTRQFVGRAQADLSDPAAVRKVIEKADAAAVINAAAYTAVDRAESEPALCLAVNRDAPAVMARACAAKDIPLLHLSTDYVFDGQKNVPYDEDDPVSPLNVYGRSKAEGEDAVRAALSRHVIVRTSGVHASHGHNFVRTMRRLAGERSQLQVVDDQTLAVTRAADIAAALMTLAVRQAIRCDGHGFGTFHFTGAGRTTWYGVASMVLDDLRQAGRPVPHLAAIPTSAYPTPARRPACSLLNCQKLLRVHGLFQRPWQEGVMATLAEMGWGAPEAV